MIRKGEEWGSGAAGAPDVEVAGSDADLGAAVTAARQGRVAGAPAPLVRFSPSPASDLARAVGLAPGARAGGPAPGLAVPVDAVDLDGGRTVVNAVVLGVAPDRLRWWHRRRPVTVDVDGRPAFDGRATTVVVANGQYLHGLDVSPRGHPGDGACEVQVYAVAPATRRAMRWRLATGSHLPHPGIITRRGRRVAVRWARPAPAEVDGRPLEPAAAFALEAVPAAYRLLI